MTIPYGGLRKSSRMDLAAAIPLAAPLTVYVEPTNVCNLSCDFCPQSLDDYKERANYHQHMPLALFSRLMDEIRQMQVKSLKLYFFGEPLMHPEIGEICRLAAPVCERVELTTNLIPLTPAKAQAIMSSGIHYIRISWYGVDEQRVRDGLKLLWSMKTPSSPHIAVKVLKEEDKPSNVACDEIVVERLHTIGSDFVHLRSYEENKRVCPYPFYNLIVKANGDVVPCCVAWETSLNVGNVHHQTLAEIWQGEPLARIQRLHLSGRAGELAACANCDTIFNCPDNIDSLTLDEYERRKA